MAAASGLNYDKIQFNQRGAGVGYAKGNPSESSTFFQFPGSLKTSSFLDSNTSNGLIRGSRGTTQLGRYLFEVRGGAVPVGGRLIGRITNSGNTPSAATHRFGARHHAGARGMTTCASARRRMFSYFKGQPDQWITAVPAYEGATYQELWPSEVSPGPFTVNRTLDEPDLSAVGST